MKNPKWIIRQVCAVAILSLIISTSSFISVATAAFTDVQIGDTHYDAINYVESEGIVGGYPDGTFKANDTINRAEFTKIIVEANVSDQAIQECIGNEFPDVPESEWYTKYICTGRSLEIIDGYPDGTFRPGETINFAEASKVIVNGFSYETEDHGGLWYEQYVTVLGDKFAIPSTITAFDKLISRGEMAEMIYRLKANVTNKYSQHYHTIAGELVDFSYYLQWAIPTEKFEWWLNQDSEDCIWMEAGWTEGGDLLSNLIGDEASRALAILNAYTPDYVRNLENLIVSQTHKEYDKDFYAFYACHMNENTDVIAGYLYPKGESATDGAGEFSMTGNLSMSDTLLVVVHADSAFLFKDVPVFGGTATGAEPPICTAGAEQNNLIWRCFQGLNINAQDEVDGSRMKYWTLPLDGNKPTSWEDVEYLDI